MATYDHIHPKDVDEATEALGRLAIAGADEEAAFEALEGVSSTSLRLLVSQFASADARITELQRQVYRMLADSEDSKRILDITETSVGVGTLSEALGQALAKADLDREALVKGAAKAMAALSLLALLVDPVQSKWDAAEALLRLERGEPLHPPAPEPASPTAEISEATVYAAECGSVDEMRACLAAGCTILDFSYMVPYRLYATPEAAVAAGEHRNSGRWLSLQSYDAGAVIGGGPYQVIRPC